MEVFMNKLPVSQLKSNSVALSLILAYSTFLGIKNKLIRRSNETATKTISKNQSDLRVSSYSKVTEYPCPNKCAFSGNDPFKQKPNKLHFPELSVAFIVTWAYRSHAALILKVNLPELPSSSHATQVSTVSLGLVIKCFTSYSVFCLRVFLCLIRNDTTIGSIACYHRQLTLA